MDFHFVLSSVFYRKFRICLTNALGYAHTLIFFSVKDITHILWLLFVPID